jgi:hypothetical protein
VIDHDVPYRAGPHLPDTGAIDDRVIRGLVTVAVVLLAAVVVSQIVIYVIRSFA